MYNYIQKSHIFYKVILPSFCEIEANILPSSIIITNHFSASFGHDSPAREATSARLRVKKVLVSRRIFIFVNESIA